MTPDFSVQDMAAALPLMSTQSAGVRKRGTDAVTSALLGDQASPVEEILPSKCSLPPTLGRVCSRPEPWDL